MTDKPVVTRIAPSPTGQMHIGTARTALFNWLYARHTGGKYLLRIEDTDRERSTDENVQVIMDGLEWLGLSPDEPAVSQFERAERHAEVARQLLETGKAYRCYMTQEEVAADREIARTEGRAVQSPWRDRDPSEAPNMPYVVRFKSPRDGETVVRDLVKGDVVFQNTAMDDLIILRSDGSPTYNLAVVVDDYDMGVTHIIRGDDHLSNAARQSLIFDAMGWEKPAFAHLPLIHGPDGAKLSKRHGAQSVVEFAEMGYLPEGMRNYLARLGWGHGDDEVFSDDQAISWFDVVDVVKAPARLDWDKLNHINNQHLRRADDGRLAHLTIEALVAQDRELPSNVLERLTTVIPLVKEGAATIQELAGLCLFAIDPRPLTLTDKAIKLLTPETCDRLERLRSALENAPDWTPATLENTLKSFAESEGVGFGKFGPALRGALAGTAVAPDLASALSALGSEEAIGRITDAICSAQ